MWPVVSILRAICSIPFTNCASVRPDRTCSRPSSASMPTANNRPGRRTVGISATCRFIITATRWSSTRSCATTPPRSSRAATSTACGPAGGASHPGMVHVLADVALAAISLFRRRRTSARHGAAAYAFLDWIKPYQESNTKLIDPPGWRILRLRRRQHAQWRLQHRHRRSILRKPAHRPTGLFRVAADRPGGAIRSRPMPLRPASMRICLTAAIIWRGPTAGDVPARLGLGIAL